MQATVSQFEIPARDPERIRQFYHTVFGWSFSPVPWEGPPYWKIGLPAGASAPSGIGGGLTSRRPGDPEQPLLVLHLAGGTLEEGLAEIVAAGGSVDLPASAVGRMGWFARFRDPEGNLLGLWQAAEAGGSQA